MREGFGRESGVNKDGFNDEYEGFWINNYKCGQGKCRKQINKDGLISYKSGKWEDNELIEEV